jgi:hypothetical protein
MYIIPVSADLGGNVDLDYALVRPEPLGKRVCCGLAAIVWIVVAKNDDPLRLGRRLPGSQQPGISGSPAGNTEERRRRQRGFDPLGNP